MSYKFYNSFVFFHLGAGNVTMHVSEMGNISGHFRDFFAEIGYSVFQGTVA